MSKRLDGSSLFSGINSGLTNSFSLLSSQYTDGLTLENINKALIYFNRAWALDASDKDCEKAINLLISKNKKAL